MVYLSEFLRLVAITSLLLGLLIFIAPAMFKNKKTGELPDRKKILIRIPILVAVLLIISIIIAP